MLPHPPRDSRTFPTASGRAEFTVSPIETLRRPARPPGAADAAQPRPVQHHDLRPQRPLPRHRGRAAGGVRAPATTWRSSGSPTATSSTWSPTGPGTTGGVRRQGFRIVSYQTPRGCAAAYYPETNPLVPLDSTAEGSNTPTSKSVVIRLERPGTASAGARRSGRRRRGRGPQEPAAAHAPVLTDGAAADSVGVVTERRCRPRPAGRLLHPDSRAGGRADRRADRGGLDLSSGPEAPTRSAG